MLPSTPDIRSRLPKMDKVLAWPEISSLQKITGHSGLKNAVRSVLEQLRTSLSSNEQPDLSPDNISTMVLARITAAATPSLRRVINGSGVVIHTNLGRSLLPVAAEAALRETAFSYSNLEFDLEQGERGERYVHVESLLCELTGAEAALVVNNNAAAVMLALSSLAQGYEVIVSRGELVEIGGSFRIPEVMRQSGATLVEVGTTNRTHPRDYINSLTEHTALLLKVHTSNFAITGFTAEVDVSTMVKIGRESGIPTMVDAGSGSLIDLSCFGIVGEATVQQYIQSGADIVTFSGDKLLGGPQAGIILGKASFIEKMKRHQLLRPLRIDKLTLAALEATLRLYRDKDKALVEIPTLRMLTISLEELSAKSRRMLRRLRSMLSDNFTLSLSDGYSSPGGGSFPLLQLPSRLIDIAVKGYTPHRVEEILRKTTPPIVGRLHKDRFLLDVRTVSESEISLLADALLQVSDYKP